MSKEKVGSAEVARVTAQVVDGILGSSKEALEAAVRHDTFGGPNGEYPKFLEQVGAEFQRRVDEVTPTITSSEAFTGSSTVVEFLRKTADGSSELS